MLYVSHRLEEVFAISDAITITRNGRDVLTRAVADLTLPEVIEGMIGQSPAALFPPALPRRAGAERQLQVTGLTGGRLADISFTARSGEIVGIAGLEGSGVGDLLGLLFGTVKARQGMATFPDGRGLPASPTAAARRGICLVPADRRHQGLMLDQTIAFNTSAVAVGARNDAPLWFSPRTALARAARQIAALRIKAASGEAVANTLSGGNQQKVVIGKWLETRPEVFLLDDPTRGVDVGAKREIYTLMRQMSADGGIVLFASTELPELIGLCDRILVIYRGRLAGDVAASGMDSRALLHRINTGDILAEATA